jgi:glycosyltransferase involved in cell wall biosynthesis
MREETVVTAGNPKVTVVVTTYNHERFIAQALESVLQQETTFAYDIIVIDDCSTDGTRDILGEFERKWPTRIRARLLPVNTNDNRSFAHAVENARSPYVAMLDGDDYWTSSRKLQKQAEFLDTHADCSLCFHNVTIVYDDGSHLPRISRPFDQKIFSGLDDILDGCFINACSAMFRRNACGKNFPDWYGNDPTADWALYVLAAQHGKIGYINEVMAVYRKHSGGFWSGLSAVRQHERVIQFYQATNARLNFTHDTRIRSLMSRKWYDLALAYEQEDDMIQARKCLRRCIDEQPLNKLIHVTELLSTWRRFYGDNGQRTEITVKTEPDSKAEILDVQ